MIVLSKSDVAGSGDPFAIAGSGFIPGEFVELSLMIDPDNSVMLGDEVQANASGAFSVAIADAGASDASGYLSVVAMGDVGSKASAPVRIVSSPVNETAVDSSLSTNVTPAGEAAMVAGAGFVAGEAVTLSVVGVAGGSDRILVGANANDSGAFLVDAPNPLEVGVYTLRAIGSKGSSATTPLVVCDSEIDEKCK
ncbi:MAG: hypothetical protein OXC95_12685 [Dehalococcoidia bacterium]|nr:hypothetical protein [Dehalococcoidia bacterium]